LLMLFRLKVVGLLHLNPGGLGYSPCGMLSLWGWVAQA
jgi:hypothetical protein